jgi:HK97 family phage prohead protease
VLNRDDNTALFYRQGPLTIRRAAPDSEPEVSVSLSSDEPIERSDWFGDRWIEILDHSTGAIDLSRAKQGLPLLRNHNAAEQVGRILQLRADDGVLRGTVRFSRGAQGQEVKQDVLDGILVETSIGYSILKFKERQLAGGLREITVTRWIPHEGSLVAVPADATVGVGRGKTRRPAFLDPRPLHVLHREHVETEERLERNLARDRIARMVHGYCAR